MTALASNPLYHPAAEPDYAVLKPEHADAIPSILQENLAAIEALLQQERFTWDNLMQPLARMENRLALAVSPISHLHSVLSTDEWRAAYEKILPELTDYGTGLSQHTALYEAVKSIQDSGEFAHLSPTRQKIIADSVRAFERSGVGLPDAEKAEFKKLSQRLSELSTVFSNNVLDATNAWQLEITDEAQLRGLPDSAKALFKTLAAHNDKEGWLLTLDAPAVIPVLTYADDRSLRETLYKAYNARASEFADDGKFDNTAVIAEILELRAKSAKMLGFADYASLSAASNKMAEEPARVFAFLEDLRAKSKAAGEADMQQLREYAKTELGLDDLQPWDVGYVSEKLQQARYAISQEDLRPYFPMRKVLDGLFALAKTLFGVQFRENTSLSVWHEDVRTFDVLNGRGELQARFTLDPYARQKKRGGAWMDSAVSRFKDGGSLQLPAAHLVCNFTPPVDGEDDAYLTHDEVTTLFHEFGHGLHHMLTEVDDYDAAGINGVEWDAVEQPSQFMENFCFHKETLAKMTAHKTTGEPLPDALFDKLTAAKNYHSAMAMLRQLEFALFDYRLHSAESAGKTALDVLKAVRRDTAVTPEYPNNRFPMQFSHIFAGGYAAGYYSYKWAEVLSADSFSAFEEEGILNPETGARFRDEILAVGSSRSAMESFRAFRGREPKVDALLRHNGIAG